VSDTLRSTRRRRARATLLGALAGLALALGDVGSTLAYLQTIPGSFQGLPHPTNLDWIAAWAALARSLTAMSGLLALATRLALLGLGWVVFRTLNPDFRLTAPGAAPGDTRGMLRRPVDRHRLRQVLGAVLVSLWLLGGLAPLPWQEGLVGLLLAGPTGLDRLWPQEAARANVFGLLLLLAALWLVWGERGLLRPPDGVARVGRRRALAAAVVAGLSLTPFALPLAPWAQTIATQVLQGIGGAARDAWLTYLCGVLVVYPLALGAAGWTAMSLAQWSHLPDRRRALAAGIGVAVVAWVGVGGLLHLAGSGRFDHGVPLAQAAGVSTGSDGALTMLTLLPGSRPEVGVTPAVSGQGLTASDASARDVWVYLRWRRFRTVHLFPALMHVCQCEALDWDSDQFLETTLRSLEVNPHPGFGQLLVEKLAHSAATPTARAALARLQDPRWFHLPATETPGMAALRQRLGPPGGEVTGRLLVARSPVVGLRVGLVDERLWQQFRGNPTTLNHRVVVASSGVDRTGSFRLREIPAGRYLMLVGVPQQRRPWSPSRTTVEGSPGPITVASGGRVDVGDVRLSLRRPRRWRDLTRGGMR
jgi:hypothetical protein